ncbi:MAG: ketoacyl-ACP synthase III [Nitrospirae bacterium]|nr:MAG: ketoacyl-ACP synthase III [Nitrospirota bacterium]
MVNTPATRIIGTGSALPKQAISNAQLAQRLKIDESYIVRVSGIRTRYWASNDEQCSTLAEVAAHRALDAAGITAHDVDVIIVSTTSPEMPFPSTACILQSRLGASRAAAFDVAASCSGFLYALSMADRLIRAGQFRRGLVVATEIKSRYVNLDDAQTAMLFGDGAGAAVLVRNHDGTSGLLDIRIGADGQRHDLITIPAGGSRQPMSVETVKHRLHTIHLRGAALYRAAIKHLGTQISALLDDHRLSVTDIDHWIFHQANGRLLAALRDRLGIADSHVLSVIEQVGNISSASLPFALDMACRQQRLQPGHLVLLGSFGGGLTWGTALLRWGSPTERPMLPTENRGRKQEMEPIRSTSRRTRRVDERRTGALS